jgi:hypothetical protein
MSDATSHAMSAASARTIRRVSAIAGLILLAVTIDALTGFTLLAPAGCITLFIVQLFAMTAGAVFAVIGAVVWAFSGFQSRQAFFVAIGAPVLVGVAVLLKYGLTWIGLACLD